MSQSVANFEVIVQDDKDSGGAWGMPKATLFAVMCKLVFSDPQWELLPISVSQAAVATYTLANLALPKWAKRRYQSHLRVQPPYLFPLVKSKCWSDSGAHVCSSPGHSCWRKVVSFVGVPWRRSWRFLCRAAQGVIESTELPDELFSLRLLAPTLHQKVNALETSPSPAVCVRCGAPKPSLTLLTVDAPQAFEACTADTVLPAWSFFANAFRRRFATTTIAVELGLRVRWIVHSSACGSGWWKVHVDVISTFLHFGLLLNFVVFADLVFRIKGLLIGSLISKLG